MQQNPKGRRSPNSGERKCTLLRVSLLLHSQLVKVGQTVNDWSNKRGLIANIDIFGCLCKFGLQD